MYVLALLLKLSEKFEISYIENINLVSEDNVIYGKTKIDCDFKTVGHMRGNNFTLSVNNN